MRSNHSRAAEVKQLAARLAQTYADTVLRISWAYLRSTADAEDVFQTVMLRVLRGDVTFADQEHEKAWIIRTTINTCKNLLGSAAYRTTVELDEAAEVATEALGEEAQVEGLTLADALEKLPTSYRAAIYLHYYEGYPIADIADATGESFSAVAKRLSRARAMLKDHLEE